MGDIDFPNLQTLSYLKQPWTHDEIQLPTLLSTNRHKHGDLFDLFWLCAVLCATPVSSMGLYQSCDCDLLSSAIFGVLSAVSIFGVLSAVSTAWPSTCARGNRQELGGVVRQSRFVFICPQSGDRFIFLLLSCVSWFLPCSSSIFKIAVFGSIVDTCIWLMFLHGWHDHCLYSEFSRISIARMNPLNI